MKTIELNGIKYEADNNETDIYLTADDHQLIFDNGYEEMKHLAIMECRHHVKSMEDEMDYDYDDDLVKEWIEENIESWCIDNINQARTILN